MAVLTHQLNPSYVDNTGVVIDYAKDPHNGTAPQAPSATQFVTDYTIPFTSRMVFGGFGFGGFDASGVPTTGTITSLSYFRFNFANPVLLVTVTGFSLPIADYLNYIAMNDNAGMLADMFSGNDTLTLQTADFFGTHFGTHNELSGYGGNDVISGSHNDDILNGGTGNDVITPFAGEDVIDGGTGIDTADFTTWLPVGAGGPHDLAVDLTIGEYRDTTTRVRTITGVENVIGTPSFVNSLTGNEKANRLVGGNLADVLAGLAGPDRLEGGEGNDTLNGGAGVDDMVGGNGNDTYFVNDPGDITTEANAAGGTDLVKTSVTRTLGANLEKLILTGSAAINGTGNTLANVITGNALANTLSGLSGADKLIGGAGGDRLIGGLGLDILTGNSGADKFVFNSAPSAASIDTITDYSAAADTVQLLGAAFVGIGGVGVLAAAKFHIGAAAAALDDRIIYDSATGKLYFDADGTSATAKIQFATLDAGLLLSAADFVVI